MIKGHYGPSDQELVEQMLGKLPAHQRDEEHRFHARQALMCLRALGYEITIEVEIYGKMEEALKVLDDGDAAHYVTHTRPVRRVQT